MCKTLTYTILMLALTSCNTFSTKNDQVRYLEDNDKLVDIQCPARKLCVVTINTLRSNLEGRASYKVYLYNTASIDTLTILEASEVDIPSEAVPPAKPENTEIENGSTEGNF